MMFSAPAVATIQTAAEVRNTLIDAIGDSPDLVVDGSQVEEADISFLQLLIAVRRSVVARGGKLSFVPAPSTALLAVFERAGLGLHDC